MVHTGPQGLSGAPPKPRWELQLSLGSAEGWADQVRVGWQQQFSIQASSTLLDFSHCLRTIISKLIRSRSALKRERERAYAYSMYGVMHAFMVYRYLFLARYGRRCHGFACYSRHGMAWHDMAGWLALQIKDDYDPNQKRLLCTYVRVYI